MAEETAFSWSALAASSFALAAFSASAGADLAAAVLRGVLLVLRVGLRVGAALTFSEPSSVFSFVSEVSVLLFALVALVVRRVVYFGVS